MRKEICGKCGKKFTPGVNGTLEPVECDECQGIVRIHDIASEASAWRPGEEFHLYGWSTDMDAAIKVTREEALEYEKKHKKVKKWF